MKKRITLILILLIIMGLFSGCKNFLSLYTETNPKGLKTKGMFVAVGESGVIYYSKDGINWTQASASYNLNGVSYGKETYVAVGHDGLGDGYVEYSSDTKIWQSIYTGTDVLRDVAYGNGKFVALSDVNLFYYSFDGISWQTASSSSDDLTKIIYENGKFVAVGGSIGSPEIYFSADGISWQTPTNMPSGTPPIEDVAYGNNKYVVVNGLGIYYSEDADNWSADIGIGSTLRAVAYGYDKFVAVGNSGVVNYSSDGVNWYSTSAGSNNLQSVCYGNGKFVAVGNSGAIYYSSDGINWSANVGTGTDHLHDVIYAPHYNAEYPLP